MPINAGYEYIAAEKAYLEAQTLEEKITCLEKMIRVAPSHKGAENLRAELKKRLIKMREKLEKGKKVGKGSKKGIRKEGFQVVLLGLANTGKSSLLAALTNARPAISQYPYTTKEPEIGTMEYEGVKVQVVDLPSLGSEEFDMGIVHTADAVLLVIDSLEQFRTVEETVGFATGKKLIVYNKSDLLNSEELRKLDATLKSRKINAVIVSAITLDNIESLKKKIFGMMDVVRIYTKEPGKQPSNIPIVLEKGATVMNVAEKILKGFSARVRETRITGPSSKFPNQKVGLVHVVMDMDIVEFHTN